MASSYTEGLVIELIGSGDKAGSWGDVTNNNLKSLNQGISGFSDIDLTGATGTDGSPYIVNLVDAQTPDESTSPSRSSIIRFYDQGTDAFVIRFQTNGAASTRINSIIVNGHASRSLVVGTGTGGTVTIPATYSARVHGDGSGLENSFANLSIDKLALGNQEVISNTVDDRVDIVSSTLQVGDGSGVAVIQSDGTGGADRDLLLRTSSAAASGQIRFNDATNGPIEITPGGEGSVVMGKVDIGGGEIDGTPIGANAASTGAFTSATVDDIVLDGKVITMTGSTSDTATLTAGTNGTLDIVTTDAAGTAANIQITADGTAELAGTTVTLDASSNITLDAESNITLDANGGTITFADDGSSLGTITSSGYSGTAATVTTNANLTGPVTSSGNATTIASGVVTGSNFNITSGSVSGDYLLAADGTGGGLKWIEQPAGDITGVTAGTNLNGGGSEGAVTVNLDSAISLANVTTSSKIVVGADSDFITGTAYISSEGGVRSSTYTSRITNQSMSIIPAGTGGVSILSNLDSTGGNGIELTCNASRVNFQTKSTDYSQGLITFKTKDYGTDGTDGTDAFQFVVNQHGAYLHNEGGQYLNFTSGSGPTGNGIRGDGSNAIEIKSKIGTGGSGTVDNWGRAYHSGMVTGDGAYVEVTSSYTGASGAAISFDISSLGVSSGDVPRILELWAKRVSGGDDIGYSEGDWIKLESRFRNGTNDVGYGIWATNSTVNIKAYNEPSWLFAPNKSDGADSALSTSGGWTIYVRAWK